MKEDAKLVSNNAAAANGSWRNVAIALGGQAPGREAALAYRARLEEVASRHPGQVGLITVVRSASTPRPEAREVMVGMFKEMWEQLACVAFVLDAGGFSGATQRMIISALLGVTSLRSRMQVFDSMERACWWMAGHLAPQQSELRMPDLAVALHHAVEDFCERYDREPNPEARKSA